MVILFICIAIMTLTACGVNTPIKQTQKGSHVSLKAAVSSESSQCSSSQSTEIETQNGLRIFTDQDSGRNFKFSVSYPENWLGQIDATSPATSSSDGSPDSGITIYPEPNKLILPDNGRKNDMIKVFGCIGHIGNQFNNPKEFKTDSGVSGTIDIQNSDGYTHVYLLLGNGFVGATVNMSNASYKKYGNEVMAVLKSIKIE